jgi:D-sedoheptulose 7-phosphate isomerase
MYTFAAMVEVQLMPNTWLQNFRGRFYADRKALPAEALHCNTSYLTAVANDYGYDEVYSRIIDGIGQEGDVLVGLSTSGNSKNIIKAFEKARRKKIITIGFTGESGARMKSCSDYLINIPSTDTPRIQESHIMAGHIICQLVEEQYFKQKKLKSKARFPQKSKIQKPKTQEWLKKQSY